PDSARLKTGYIPQFGNRAGNSPSLVLVNYGNNAQMITAQAVILDTRENEGQNTSLITIQRVLASNERLEARLDQLFGFKGATSIASHLTFTTPAGSAGILGYLESNTGGAMTTVMAQRTGDFRIFFFRFFH